MPRNKQYQQMMKLLLTQLPDNCFITIAIDREI